MGVELEVNVGGLMFQGGTNTVSSHERCLLGMYHIFKKGTVRDVRVNLRLTLNVPYVPGVPGCDTMDVFDGQPRLQSPVP
jgi:hypothetical protein